MSRIRDSYTEIVALARRHGIEPILATEVTMGRRDSWSETVASWIGALRGKESYQDRVSRHVQETNRWLVEFAARERLLVLDLKSVLAGQGLRRRPEFTQDDGSHITPRGYAALTEYARPILERHLVKTTGS